MTCTNPGLESSMIADNVKENLEKVSDIFLKSFSTFITPQINYSCFW